MRRPPASGDEIVEVRAPLDVDVLGAERERLGRAAACALPPDPVNAPPSHAGRHVTITGRRRPASAPATSGIADRVEPQLDQVGVGHRVAPPAQLRHRGRGDGDDRAAVSTSDQIKKPLQPCQAEEAWSSQSRGGRSGQGGCLFGSAPIPPRRPEHAGRAGRIGVERDVQGHSTNHGMLGRYQTRPIGVNPIAHFSLTSKHFSRITGLNHPCHCTGSPSSLLLAAAGPRPVCAPPRRRCAIAEIRPGMIGIGRTVFDGTQVEEFKVQHPRRPRERHRHAAQSDPRPARRRSARQDRRHRRHERQPGVHGRPADWRRLLRARQLLEGTDRRHHADRRDDGRDGVQRDARPSARARARRVSADARGPDARVSQGAQLESSVCRSARRRAVSPACSGVAGTGRRRARRRCCGRSPRRSSCPASSRSVADTLGGAFRDQGFLPIGGGAAGARAGEMPFDGPLKPGDAIGVDVRQRRSRARRAPARSRTSTATTSTRSAIRCTTSGRPNSR